MKHKALKAAFPHTLPIMAGYLALGMGFGILLESKGFSPIWAFCMSLFIYAGSLQYVAVELFSSGASFVYAAFISIMLQIRHLFYGLTLIEKYRNLGKKKPLMIQELTDETYSLICSATPPDDVDTGWFYFFISTLNHLYWIVGCTFGAVLGSLIPFNTKGIDFVMTALFVVIFTDQWLSAKDHSPALIGLFASLICLLIFGTQNFIIPSMLLISLLLTVFRKTLERRGDLNENF